MCFCFFFTSWFDMDLFCVGITGRRKQKVAKDRAGLAKVRANCLDHCYCYLFCLIPAPSLSFLTLKMLKQCRSSFWRRSSWGRSCWRRVTPLCGKHPRLGSISVRVFHIWDHIFLLLQEIMRKAWITWLMPSQSVVNLSSCCRCCSKRCLHPSSRCCSPNCPALAR